MKECKAASFLLSRFAAQSSSTPSRRYEPSRREKIRKNCKPHLHAVIEIAQTSDPRSRLCFEPFSSQPSISSLRAGRYYKRKQPIAPSLKPSKASAVKFK
jgi:hypothetical protein